MKLMKKMGKRLSKALVMLLMTTSVENANAQAEWNYSYDATGNRTQRTVNNGSSARKKASSNKNLFEDGRINAILDREHNKCISSIFLIIYLLVLSKIHIFAKQLSQNWILYE
jgi:YD repeat-containing protein